MQDRQGQHHQQHVERPDHHELHGEQADQQAGPGAPGHRPEALGGHRGGSRFGLVVGHVQAGHPDGPDQQGGQADQAGVHGEQGGQLAGPQEDGGHHGGQQDAPVLGPAGHRGGRRQLLGVGGQGGQQRVPGRPGGAARRRGGHGEAVGHIGRGPGGHHRRHPGDGQPLDPVAHHQQLAGRAPVGQRGHERGQEGARDQLGHRHQSGRRGPAVLVGVDQDADPHRVLGHHEQHVGPGEPGRGRGAQDVAQHPDEAAHPPPPEVFGTVAPPRRPVPGDSVPSAAAGRRGEVQGGPPPGDGSRGDAPGRLRHRRRPGGPAGRSGGRPGGASGRAGRDAGPTGRTGPRGRPGLRGRAGPGARRRPALRQPDRPPRVLRLHPQLHHLAGRPGRADGGRRQPLLRGLDGKSAGAVPRSRLEVLDWFRTWLGLPEGTAGVLVRTGGRRPT